MITKAGFYFRNAASYNRFREKVYLLEAYIFNCIKIKNFRKALFAQKVLLFTSEIYYLSIRYITQLRLDRKIPGIDNTFIDSAKQQKHLFTVIQKTLPCWSFSPMRAICLVDFFKVLHMVFIPTISDRIVQYIWGIILEPVSSAVFFEEIIFSFSLRKFLFAKYISVLKLLSYFKVHTGNLFQFKCKCVFRFAQKVNLTYLFNTILFPEVYKKELVLLFKMHFRLNTSFMNEDLYFYLNILHYFIISFALFGFNQLFSREFLRILAASNLIVLVLNCVNEILYFLNTELKDDTFSPRLFEPSFKSCFFLVQVKKQPCYLSLEFLDWRVITGVGNKSKLIPVFWLWKIYKNNFKRILLLAGSTLYQRIRILHVFVQNIIYRNWLCSLKFFKKRIRVFYIWVSYYFNTYTNLQVDEKKFILHKLFTVCFQLETMYSM